MSNTDKTAFSANLGFLFTEFSLPDAIHQARQAGFQAVECHFPYETPADEVIAALTATQMRMIGLNTVRGDTANGDNGLAAVEGRTIEARAAIEQAVTYAAAISAGAVHVMAGIAQGEGAHATFVDNLKYACNIATEHGVTILIEPLNKYDAPGYFLTTTEQAIGIINEVNQPNIKLMFDCYHVQLMEGNLSNRLRETFEYIGHIQFASVPDRGAPDHGELNYSHVFAELAKLGYKEPLGAEYKPSGSTLESLGWLQRF